MLLTFCTQRKCSSSSSLINRLYMRSSPHLCTVPLGFSACVSLGRQNIKASSFLWTSPHPRLRFPARAASQTTAELPRAEHHGPRAKPGSRHIHRWVQVSEWGMNTLLHCCLVGTWEQRCSCAPCWRRQCAQIAAGIVRPRPSFRFK